ncbi:MAG: hypothetical protein AAF202_11785, partial [Pseudomonadota bacterium]
ASNIESSEPIGPYQFVENKKTHSLQKRSPNSDLEKILQLTDSVLRGEKALSPLRELMIICQSSELLKPIRRLCFSVRHGLSNEIRTVDSLHANPLLANELSTGYRCLVSPQSSLLHMKANEVRYTESLGSVIESFEKEGRPIQRSLQKVYDLGFRESLCIPIQLRPGQNQGFLYLNSKREGEFRALVHRISNEIDAIQRLALVMLGQLAPTLDEAFSKKLEELDKKTFFAQPFERRNLENSLRALSDEHKVKIHLSRELTLTESPPLVSHGNLGAFLCLLYEEFKNSLSHDIHFSAESVVDQLEFFIEIKSEAQGKLEKAIANFNDKASYFGVVVKLNTSFLHMRNLSEAADDKILHYTRT